MENSIKILGSGNAFNIDGRFNSSYLLTLSGKYTLFDFGFTTLLAIRNKGIKANEIDTIIISHYHGDHIAGLAAFFLELYYVYKQTKPITIIGPIDIEERILKLQEVLYPSTSKIFEHLDVVYYEARNGDELELDDYKLKAFDVQHSEKAKPLGYILDFKGSKIGFSGDTGICKGLIEIVEESDLAIIEANFINKTSASHCSLQELSEIFPKLKNSKKVYLTHLTDAVAEAAKDTNFVPLKDGDEFFL